MFCRDASRGNIALRSLFAPSKLNFVCTTIGTTLQAVKVIRTSLVRKGRKFTVYLLLLARTVFDCCMQ